MFSSNGRRLNETLLVSEARGLSKQLGSTSRDGKIGLARLLGSVRAEGLSSVDVVTTLSKAPSVITLRACSCLSMKGWVLPTLLELTATEYRL